jgi:hypothetical protein
MKRNFPDFVHADTMETAHADRMQRREIEFFKEIGATLLCVEFDEPHPYKDGRCLEETCCNDIVYSWRGRTVFLRVNTHSMECESQAWLTDLHWEMEDFIERFEDGLNTTFLEVWYLHYVAGVPDVYDEHTEPPWLDTWLACQDL